MLSTSLRSITAPLTAILPDTACTPRTARRVEIRISKCPFGLRSDLGLQLPVIRITFPKLSEGISCLPTTVVVGPLSAGFCAQATAAESATIKEPRLAHLTMRRSKRDDKRT